MNAEMMVESAHLELCQARADLVRSQVPELPGLQATMKKIALEDLLRAKEKITRAERLLEDELFGDEFLTLRDADEREA